MIDFQTLLLNGYSKENAYFLKYLLREQKKAESEHYDSEEFFNKCLDVIKGFKEDIQGQYYERKTEIYLMKSMSNFSEENFKDAMEDNKLQNHPVQLHYYTGGKFSGQLYYSSILDIELKVNQAWEIVLKNKYNELPIPEISATPENEINPYPEIFKDYYSFKLFERLYDSYKDNSDTYLANFSFLYRQMHAEGLILEYQKPEMFRLWLSKEYVVIDYKFKTLDNCAPQSKLPEYNAAKELVKLELKQHF